MTLPVGYRRIDMARERSAEFFAIDAWAFALPDAEVSAAAIAETVDWSRSRGVETVQTSENDQGEPGQGELVAVHSAWKR